MFDEHLIGPGILTRPGIPLAPVHFATNYDGGPIDAADIYRGLQYVPIPYASPVVWDMSQGINFSLAITASVSISFPTNVAACVGKTGYLDVLSSGGAFVFTFTSSVGYTFEGGTMPTNDNTSGRYTQYWYHVRSATEVRIGLALRGVR